MKDNCTFVAFKSSGKMYTSARGYLSSAIFDTYTDDKLRFILDVFGKWPGLSGAGKEFTRVMILDDDVNYGFPILFKPTE